MVSGSISTAGLHSGRSSPVTPPLVTPIDAKCKGKILHNGAHSMPIPPMGLWAYLLEQEKSKEIRRGRASSLSDTSRDRPSSSDSCAGSETVDTSSEDGADDAVYNTSSDISEEEANERTSIILPDIITPAINTASVTEAFKLIIDTEAAIDETELKNYFERFGPFHTFEVNSTHTYTLTYESFDVANTIYTALNGRSINGVHMSIFFTDHPPSRTVLGAIPPLAQERVDALALDTSLPEPRHVVLHMGPGVEPVSVRSLATGCFGGPSFDIQPTNYYAHTSPYVPHPENIFDLRTQAPCGSTSFPSAFPKCAGLVPPNPMFRFSQEHVHALQSHAWPMLFAQQVGPSHRSEQIVPQSPRPAGPPLIFEHPPYSPQPPPQAPGLCDRHQARPNSADPNSVTLLQARITPSTTRGTQAPLQGVPQRNQLNIRMIEEEKDLRTTVMVKNIPNKMTADELEEILFSVQGVRVNFMYLRMDFKTNANMSYAFVNFLTTGDLLAFARAKLGTLWGLYGSDKVLQMCYANIQDRTALIARFRNTSALSRREDWRPRIYYSSGPMQGQREDFS